MDRVERGDRRDVKMQTTFSWSQSSPENREQTMPDTDNSLSSVRSGPTVLNAMRIIIQGRNMSGHS